MKFCAAYQVLWWQTVLCSETHPNAKPKTLTASIAEHKMPPLSKTNRAILHPICLHNFQYMKLCLIEAQAAGVIPTDFEKGFIRAEVMKYDDLKRLGTEQAIKDAGLYKVEGKEYIVHDGDIMYFRFNV